MTTTDIAINSSSGAEAARVAARSAIELSADQRGFTPQQVAALKELGIDDAPTAVLDLFFHRCRTTGLDPFNKQIYLIGRNTKVGGYGKGPERWETKWTTQTGIDGYRLNGHRAAAKAGNKVRTEGPFWQGENGGGWSEVALFGKDENGRKIPPAVAKYIIWVDGEPHVGIAHYDEFVQTTGYGDKATPNSMWTKMPANQLAKCAEAQAWRKAYPEDFSGLVLEDAAQVIEPDGQPSTVRAQAERMSAAALTAASAPPQVQQWQPAAEEKADESPSEEGVKPDNPQAEETAQASPEPAEEPAPPVEKMSTRTQQTKISNLLDEHGVAEPADKLLVLGEKFKRTFSSSKELTHAEAVEMIAYLELPPDADERQADADASEGAAQ
ncbi:recombinase RecT [Nocardia sp. NPDC050630]|uniref:recombinase RecT n=1 Tax=Nocardia sp. NPDC050630 TaxID=3364321 RepID=UPI0037A34BF0